MNTIENELTSKIPYWTVELVDGIIARLREKYPANAEDSVEVCALFEFRKILKQLRVHEHSIPIM